jgi:undecaprenyl diphosphate synthase
MTDERIPVPKHIAIIMDGNGRWAKKRLQPRFMGHRAGIKSVENVIKFCVKQEIAVITLFAFSSENWRRPSKEVSLLMDLFSAALKQQVKRLHSNNIRLKIIGDVSKFSDSLQTKIIDAETLTKHNTGLIINIAANYGGRWDITQATQQVAAKVQAGELALSDINEDVISRYLSTADQPEPELFIRTGGEQRISNFLMWQLAYTELYFTDTLWPDFNEEELALAIDSFSKRERRFGKTSEQIQGSENA